MGRECLICGRPDWIERHHLFQGSNRKLSEQYGLVADLCHYCHNEPPDGAHHNAEVMENLHCYGQALFMLKYRANKDDFRKLFGANYL